MRWSATWERVGCVAFRSNYYDPSDVWSPLMLQKPLLMDPVNPFSNVADPQVPI